MLYADFITHSGQIKHIIVGSPGNFDKKKLQNWIKAPNLPQLFPKRPQSILDMVNNCGNFGAFIHFCSITPQISWNFLDYGYGSWGTVEGFG